MEAKNDKPVLKRCAFASVYRLAHLLLAHGIRVYKVVISNQQRRRQRSTQVIRVVCRLQSFASRSVAACVQCD